MNGKTLSREYALVCHGRCVAIARGSSVVQGFNSVAASTESVKSNALMRTCKDLGVAWQLWDSHFVAEFKLKKGIQRSSAASSRY
jgi:NO-binding membrane sensor protein with MHYT domain